MTDAALLDRPSRPASGGSGKPATVLAEHIVEVISDSGEGAQRCGQSLGAIAARSGNGIWTVEIIPAEIQPPARSVAGASGIRIRMGTKQVTNGGDETDLVVAFNEQVLLGPRARGRTEARRDDPAREHVARAQRPEDRRVVPRDGQVARGERLPRHRGAARARVPRADDRRAPRQEHVRAGHAVQHLQPRPDARARPGRADLRQEGREGHRAPTCGCSRRASRGREANLDFKYRDPGGARRRSRRSSSTATPRSRSACSPRAWTSARCTRSRRRRRRRTTCPTCFERVGGMVHQAEDEIAACAFAIGASYAGKLRGDDHVRAPATRSSRKASGLAVMAEIPLVVVNVQRGGPSHRPADQGRAGRPPDRDLRQPRRRAQGRAWRSSDIEDCFYSMITARKIAETFNMVVVVLSDASLATAQQPFPRPAVQRGLAGAADRPDAGARRRQALRLGPGHRHRAPLHPRAAGRHAHAHRARARPRRARSPTTRRSTRKACARAA